MSEKQSDDDIIERDETSKVSQSSDALKGKQKAQPKSDDLLKAVGGEDYPKVLGAGRTKFIAGLDVRPVTLASLEMLRMIKSPLIEGVQVEDTVELLPHCLDFLYIHCVPEDDALDFALEDEAKARKKLVLKWSAKIDLGNIGEFVTHTLSVLESASATQVAAKYPDTATVEGSSGNS